MMRKFSRTSYSRKATGAGRRRQVVETRSPGKPRAGRLFRALILEANHEPDLRARGKKSVLGKCFDLVHFLDALNRLDKWLLERN